MRNSFEGFSFFHYINSRKTKSELKARLLVNALTSLDFYYLQFRFVWQAQNHQHRKLLRRDHSAKALHHPLAIKACAFLDRCFIQRQQLPIAHEDPAIDDHG